MVMTKSIILLSAGLDSLVALGSCKDKYGVDLALTFDYGQKAVKQEISASKKICEYYKIQHKVIVLDWLKEITRTSLVSNENVPSVNLGTKESASLVWVPNRNALFLNIAASFADSFNYDYILFGANKDEAETFPDNTESFRSKISDLFQISTLAKPKVVAPLINFTKNDIVKVAMESNIPLEFVRSCYIGDEKHCGECESYKHLREALLANNGEKYLNILF